MLRILAFLPAVAALVSPLHITGAQNLELTDAMREYATSKLTKPLETHAVILNPASAVELHLKVNHLGKHDEQHLGREAHVAEITAYCKDKAVIRATSECEDMYASLDELTDVLSRKLRKHKEKKMDVKQGRRRDDKAVLAESLVAPDDDDEFD